MFPYLHHYATAVSSSSTSAHQSTLAVSPSSAPLKSTTLNTLQRERERKRERDDEEDSEEAEAKERDLAIEVRDGTKW